MEFLDRLCQANNARRVTTRPVPPTTPIMVHFLLESPDINTGKKLTLVQKEVQYLYVGKLIFFMYFFCVCVIIWRREINTKDTKEIL